MNTIASSIYVAAMIDSLVPNIKQRMLGQYLLEAGIANTGIVELVSDKVPASFIIGKAYPNPFNPATTVEFDIPVTSDVVINIYDVNGIIVRNLVNHNLTAGSYKFDFNAEGLSSGVYFARIQAAEFSGETKLILMK
jgi:hypothetical protein